MPARAEIYGLRTHDNRLSIWFEVLPELTQAYCFPGKGCLHVVFGGRNVGDADGYLWGRLIDVEKGTSIIAKKKLWCAVGNFVWWEKTFDMPTHNLLLRAEVGSNEGVDESHEFSVYAGEPPFDYTWTWIGRTNKATFNWKERPDGTVISGHPPPSDARLVEAAKSAYYGVIFGEFARKCSEQNVNVRVVDIVPSAWVERGDLKKYLAYPRVPEYTCKQSLIVHVGGKVYFNSSQDLVGSPIATAMVVAIGKVVAMVILAVFAGLAVLTIIEVFRDMATEESTVTKTNRVTVGDEGWTTTDDITLPDGTVIPAGTYFPPGTVIEWETEEKEEKPAIGGILVLGILALFALGLAPKVVKAVRRKD